MLPSLSIVLAPHRIQRLWAPLMPGHNVDPRPASEERRAALPLLLHDLLSHGLFPDLDSDLQEVAAIAFQHALLDRPQALLGRLHPSLSLPHAPEALARGLRQGADLRAALGGRPGIEALVRRARAVQAGLPAPLSPRQRIRVRLPPDATFSTEDFLDQSVPTDWTRLVLGPAAARVPGSWSIRLGAPLAETDDTLPSLLSAIRCPWLKTPLLPVAWGAHAGGVLCAVPALPRLRLQDDPFAIRTLADRRSLFLIQDSLLQPPLRQAA